ncbi:MAG: hypothetical protein ACOC83_07670 [Gemmatimonadota bacterium]
MRNTRDRLATIAAMAAGGLLLLGQPGGAAAQAVDQPWTVEGRGGISVPAGDLADVFDVGPSFGAGIGYRVHPRVTLRVDGDVGILSGADDLATGTEAPDTRLWHYNGGVEVELTEPGASRWNVTANLAGGATTFDGDDFEPAVTNPATGESVTDFSETYFTANGGLKVGYDVTPSVNVFAGGQWYLAFTDEEDTAVFSALSPSEIDAFDTASEIPVVVGVRASF